MLRRRQRYPVLAEVPASRDTRSARPGALGRAQLEAYAALARGLSDSGSVLTSGPAGLTAALGLATAAISEGRRVALLECDLAAPALAGILRLRVAPGLHEYLVGEAEAPLILQPLVLAGPASARATEPLACIVAGEPSSSPSALLASEHCQHAIAKLRRAYDLLVIAAPPFAEEPRALAALAEQAETAVACGRREDIPKRLPVPVAGLVLFG